MLWKVLNVIWKGSSFGYICKSEAHQFSIFFISKDGGEGLKRERKEE